MPMINATLDAAQRTLFTELPDELFDDMTDHLAVDELMCMLMRTCKANYALTKNRPNVRATLQSYRSTKRRSLEPERLSVLNTPAVTHMATRVVSLAHSIVQPFHLHSRTLEMQRVVSWTSHLRCGRTASAGTASRSV